MHNYATTRLPRHRGGFLVLQAGFLQAAPSPCRQGSGERRLHDVERVEDKHVVVVLGERDNVALGGDLEPAAATHLHVGTLKLTDERAVPLEYGHVKTVAVGVTDQHVASIADVDAVGEVGDVLAANAAHEHSLLVEHNYAVTLSTNDNMVNFT